MKQACTRFFTLLFAAAFLAPSIVMAQNEDKVKENKIKEEKNKKKEGEQIIITRKGNNTDKVIIEIQGDKITVNGKSIDELKDGDVTVRRNKLRDVWAYADGLKGGTVFGPGEQFRMFSMDSNRAFLGVSTEKVEKGVEVDDVTEESAASKAGLKEGDIITRIGEKKIETPDDLSSEIKKHKPGDKVTITYLRDNKEQKATAELSKWKGSHVFGGADAFKMDMGDLHLDEIMPRVQQSFPRTRVTPNGMYRAGSGPRLGLSVQDTEDGKGVKIIDVDEESHAAKAGLKSDDIITEVEGKAVNSADEVARIIRESKDKISVKVKLNRSGKTQNVEVKIPRKLKSVDL